MPLGADTQLRRAGERQALARVQKIIFQHAVAGHPDAALLNLDQGDFADTKVEHLHGLQG